MMEKIALTVTALFAIALNNPAMAFTNIYYDDAGSHMINSNAYKEDTIYLDYNMANNPGTNLTVGDMGEIWVVYAYNNSEVEVKGGTVSEYLGAYDNSTVIFSGGSINMAGLDARGNSKVTVSGGSIGFQLRARDNSSVTLTGGTILSFLEAKNTSTVTISGGAIGDSLYAHDSSTVMVNGGEVGGDINALDSSMIEFHGSDFSIDGIKLSLDSSLRDYATLNGLYLTGTITGTLLDGTTLNNTFRIENDAVADIIINVPAPVLIALEISGPNEMIEDGFGQFTAIAVYDDGSTTDVTDSVEWSLSSDEFAVIDSSGLVVCGGLDVDGEFAVYASYAEGDIVVEAEKVVSYLPVFVSYHVDGVYGSDDNDGLLAETAFATIQHAIDVTEDNDSVLVWPEVYNENVDFAGKAITVQGIGGVPVIDGGGYWAVSFFSGEGPGSVLKNVMVTNGYMGIFIAGSSPTIQNVNVIGNMFGIEAYSESYPDIVNCILWDNSDGDLFGCQGRFSCVERAEEAAGQGNIIDLPMFADPDNGDFRLLSQHGRFAAALDMWVLDDVTSPCVNTGDPAINPADEIMPNGGRVNIGAYGGTAEASRGPWVLAGDINQDGTVDLADFAVLAENWLGELEWIEK